MADRKLTSVHNHQVAETDMDEEIPEKSVATLGKCLLDLSQPIAKRTHAAFFLRTIASEEALDVILEGIYH